MRPVIAVTCGDPSGVGPEVTLAALARPKLRRTLTPVLFGDAAIAAGLRGYDTTLGPLRSRPTAPTLVVVSRLAPKERRAGAPSMRGARAQLAYIDAAVQAARDGWVDGLCTAPVSKEQISRTGRAFSGHTELLAEAFGVEVMMLMDGPRLKVALATNHVPVSRVAALLTTERLVSQLRLLSSALETATGKRPRIAVCALNPHAGDGGVIGHEDADVVAPAVQKARRLGIRCEGPFGADGLFAHQARGFDAVLAMYHDQGLIPVKALDFARTVNVTLGLPVPRTSPDHGVAYDIAGKGLADARPMVSALQKLVVLVQR